MRISISRGPSVFQRALLARNGYGRWCAGYDRVLNGQVRIEIENLRGLLDLASALGQRI